MEREGQPVLIKLKEELTGVKEGLCALKKTIEVLWAWAWAWAKALLTKLIMGH